MSSLVMLEDEEQLRKHAEVTYHREAERVKYMPFKTKDDQVKHLGYCKYNYESLLELVDTGAKLKSEFPDKTRSDIADDVNLYLMHATNFAIQMLHNYILRMKYIDQIKGFAKDTKRDLRKLGTPRRDQAFLEEARKLAEMAVNNRNEMLELTRAQQSTAPRAFSIWLKDSGVPFDKIIQRYQNKLGFGGPFTDLSPRQKKQVFARVIEASGWRNYKVNMAAKVLGAAGETLLLWTHAVMAWDIYSAEQTFETAAYYAAVPVASDCGALLGEVVAVILKTCDAPASFVTIAGLVSSIGGAYFLGEYAGSLFENYINSGGQATHEFDDQICYVESLPGGAVLARQIQYKKKHEHDDKHEELKKDVHNEVGFK